MIKGILPSGRKDRRFYVQSSIHINFDFVQKRALNELRGKIFSNL